MRSLTAVFPILILFTLFACSSENKTENAVNDAIAVKSGKIRQVREPERISVSGTVASPDAPTAVSFQVSGKVIRVGPREGEYVQKGQLLAAIDPTDYDLAARAVTAQVKQAGIGLERSRDEYNRMKFLYESKSLAGNDFEKFKAAWLSARQQLDQATANEKLSQKRLRDTSLHAPVSGFISKRSIEPGETAGAGRPVFEIVTLDPVEISVGVPETDIHLIRIGQKAEIKIPALPGELFPGTVRVIGVSADSNTRTYTTRITVPNPEHILRVGMVAEAHVRGDRMLDLMTLPVEAIVRDPQGATMVFVYYPDQGRVYARRVETGTVHGREIVIRSGISGDETIVLSGQEKLWDGVGVSVVAEDSPAGGQNTPEAGARK